MINEDGFLIDEIGLVEIYIVYICWGVIGYYVKSVYIYVYVQDL